MSQLGTEILLILLLLVANGVFAMTEIAVVSVRKARLKRLADQGDARARAALELAQSPNRFLSTVQVGITLVGVFAGAFGGATIAEKIAAALKEVTWLEAYADGLGLGIVVVAITYLSLVIGELVPKRLALANPEGIARVMAGPMNRLSALVSPVVRLLGVSTDLLLRLLGQSGAVGQKVSEDEVRVLMEEGLQEGVFHQAEPRMVEGVLALDRLPVRDLMTPRAKILWISVDDPHESVWHKIVVSGHTAFPVYEGNRDNVLGFVTVKALYAHLAANIPIQLRDLTTTALVVPSSQNALALLETFKKARHHIALVVDEFGGIVGLVTLHDIMEAVLGDVPSQEERLRPTARRRDDGSWLVDAMMEIEEFARLVPAFRFPPSSARDYATVGGYVLKELGHIPQEGESFPAQGYHVEVIDMDERRVDKVLLMPLRPPTAGGGTGSRGEGGSFP